MSNQTQDHTEAAEGVETSAARLCRALRALGGGGGLSDFISEALAACDEAEKAITRARLSACDTGGTEATGVPDVNEAHRAALPPASPRQSPPSLRTTTSRAPENSTASCGPTANYIGGGGGGGEEEEEDSGGDSRGGEVGNSGNSGSASGAGGGDGGGGGGGGGGGSGGGGSSGGGGGGGSGSGGAMAATPAQQGKMDDTEESLKRIVTWRESSGPGKK